MNIQRKLSSVLIIFTKKNFFSIIIGFLMVWPSLTVYATQQETLFTDSFSEKYNRKLSTEGLPENLDIDSFERILLGISSCESNGCTLIMPELYRDKNKIYCYPSGAGKNKLTVMEEADADTFNVYSHSDVHWVMDKRDIYKIGQDGACYTPALKIKSNMKHIYANIFKNKKNVYYYDSSKEQMVKIKGANAIFFKESKKMGGLLSDKLFQDNRFVYAYDGYSVSKMNVHKNSFKRVFPKDVPGFYSDWLILKDKNNFYYAKDGDLESIQPFVDVDMDSFTVLYTDPYGMITIAAKDKYAFYHVNIFGKLTRYDDIDMQTFVNIPTNGLANVIFYSKDKNNVYKSTDFSKLEWADPNTFEVSAFEYGHSEDSEYFIYGKNKDQFWYFDARSNQNVILEEIDSSTFKVIGDFTMEKHIEAEKRPTNKLHYIDSGICEDLNSFVEELQAIDWEAWIETLDDGTCNLVYKEFVDAHDEYFYGVLAKDNNSVWMYDNEQYILQKLANLKGNTFEEMTEGILYKDENGIYVFRGGAFYKVEGVNPLTAKGEVLNDKLYLKDGENVWQFDNDQFLFEKIDDINL